MRYKAPLFHAFLLPDQPGQIKLEDIPVIPAKAWDNAETARELLKRYSKSLAFIDKISKMDYALPADFRFSFTDPGQPSGYAYFRFLCKLRALSMKFGDRREIGKTLHTLLFIRKYVLQSDLSVQFLAGLTCQRLILDKLRQKKVSPEASEFIKKVLIRKSDYSNALKADLLQYLDNMKNFTRDPQGPDFNFKEIFKGLFEPCSLCVS